MPENWVRQTLIAELLSDTHLGSGSGGNGIDALLARDRQDRPVIWASHVEGVLRDAARRLRGDAEAEAFFGRAGGDYSRGDRQRAIFTSLYMTERIATHIWSSTARASFDNRAPKEDTLRVIEYVPTGTKFRGEVELPASDLATLQRLVQEVDALGGGRSTGAGRVKLSLSEIASTPCKPDEAPRETGRLILLLKNREPLCITATATPDNLIPSLAYVPGRALLGAIASWLIAEGEREAAKLFTTGEIAVSDALPLPHGPTKLDGVEVLPAPLSLQSEKPGGNAKPSANSETDNVRDDIPWWARPIEPTKRFNAWEVDKKLKRPEDDLFVFRESPQGAWTTFRPARRVRLRNGRPVPTDPTQKAPLLSLFAIEQIAEETYFRAELQGAPEDLKAAAEKLAPILERRRWLRVGRAGAPVEVTQTSWSRADIATYAETRTLLTLTSDLLVRDEFLRWKTALDEKALRELIDDEDISLVQTKNNGSGAMQDSVMVHGFNGTACLWRMPAAAIRRGSVFEVSGTGVTKLAQRLANGAWLGERTHEGFGRFRLDAVLPGVTSEAPASKSGENVRENGRDADREEEAVAAKSQEWFDEHRSLANPGSGKDRKPSLAQWFELIRELERGSGSALASRLNPTTAGGKNWKYSDAVAVLKKFESLGAEERSLHARYFVRWLRAAMRQQSEEAQ